jgi:hypothetical protein
VAERGAGATRHGGSGENCECEGEVVVSVYGRGGDDMTTEDSTTHSIRTHHILLHYTTTQPNTPILSELNPPPRGYQNPPSTAAEVKAIVLLPCDGVLRACGLVEVSIKGDGHAPGQG